MRFRKSRVLWCSIALLVPIKGWLVNSQYFYKAGEGVLAGPVSSEPRQCEDCRRRYAKRKRQAVLGQSRANSTHSPKPKRNFGNNIA